MNRFDRRNDDDNTKGERESRQNGVLCEILA